MNEKINTINSSLGNFYRKGGRPKKIEVIEKEKNIIADYKSCEVTIENIAKKYNVSRSTIYAIIKKHRFQEQQEQQEQREIHAKEKVIHVSSVYQLNNENISI